ncbi:ImmA/IrrE family metallo-endopeptidase [Thiorhodovibrio frisius]|uniref:Putative Zn peptidase n=1 Tax=Thiorhodovibrio frisius TaxID=631362 RepID=H8YYS7_9GAMM|nr:ImmA/IrrE family metallo-endopeptidase [Thiorhodovibrio frisius]EIC23603.1 putative Zn peptidase [Thiorhodovibrio frisius]WPL23310.1 conjugal transfer protein TrbA [Thiorhodovibrio frisius]
MKERIGGNLLRLRRERSLSQETLATQAGLSLLAYRNLEKGRSEPRRNTLLALAAALDVPIKALLQPARHLQRVRFRSLKKLKRRDQVLADIALRLANFIDLEAMTGDRLPHELKPLWDELSHQSEQNIPELAGKVRKHFGLNNKEPVHDICGLLESRGIKVLSLEVLSDGFMGLSVAEEDGGPAVVVNTWHRLPVETWIFSAAHELGHLLLHLNAYDVGEEREDQQQEREADSFASHFLMPQAAFANEWQDAEGLPLLDRVFKIKRVFRVSWRTVLYRVAESEPEQKRALIWQRFNRAYQQRNGKSLLKHDEPDGIAREIYHGDQAQRSTGLEPARMEKYDFQGDRLWRLTRHAVENDQITLSRASEILRLPLLEMRELSASWML